MSLKNIIITKTMSALAVLFTVFSSASVFAQDAAATVAATAKPVDMGPIYKSTLFYVLLFLLLCLFIAIIGKALKVYELTRETQGKPEGINWNNINGVLFAIFLVVGLYGVYWEYTVHGSMILPEAASEHGKRIDEMFNITLIITTIVFIVTHIILFFFTYYYKSKGNRKAYFYPHNNALERLWTIIPALVLTVLVLMGFLTWRSIFNKEADPNNKPLSIEVTSSQFQWDLRYPGVDGVVGLKNYKKIHGDKYLYDKSDFSKKCIIIECKKHGEFKQNKYEHNYGKGCIKCGYESISEKNKESASLWSYINWQKAGNKSKSFNLFKVYIIRCWNENEEFYKIGKTFVSINKRFTISNLPYKYEIVKMFESKGDGIYISKLEKKLQKQNKENKYLPKLKFRGMYECFKQVNYEL